MAPPPSYDLIIVGAGPIGLEAAIRAKRIGLNYLVIDQGCIVNAIASYPTYMTFFTTSERLEIGGHPLVSARDKPTRKEALDYYRKVVANEALEVRTYIEVTGLTREAEGFLIATQDDRGAHAQLRSRFVALATGYFDHPRKLGVPGEERAYVSHYYSEAHPFFERNVTIVGAGSSAADAALDLFRGGARVTIVHRGSDFRHSLKYWVRPDLVNRVKEGSITAHFDTEVEEITAAAVIVRRRGEQLVIATDQTFLLTGYVASPALLNAVGARVDPSTLAAKLDPESYQSDVPGLYVIGSAGFGIRTSDVFIENGLVHAEKALDDIARHLERRAAAV